MKKEYTLRRSIHALFLLLFTLLSFACSEQSPNSQDDSSSPFSHLSKEERIQKGLEFRQKINGAKFLLEYYKQMPTSEEAASTFSGTDFRQLAYLWENDLNYFPKILAELSIFETTLKKVAATGDKTATLP